MVQIIEEGPSGAQRFARAIGAAAESAADIVPEYMANQESNRKQKKFGKFASELTKQDLEDLPYETQVKYLESFLKQRNAENLEDIKARKKEELFNKKMGFLDKLEAGTQEQRPNGILSQDFGGAYPGQQAEETGQKLQGFASKDLSDLDIAKATVADQGLGRTLQHGKDVGLREEREREALEYRKGQDVSKEEARQTTEAQKETLKIRQEFADKAKFARQLLESKKSLVGLLNKGNIDSPFKVYASSLLPGAIGNALLSADTLTYKAGLFDEFGVLRQMFPGATRTKELVLLEDKLATLDKNDEAKEEILATSAKKLERDVILADAARKVEKQHPKARLLDFEERVYEEAKPKLDVLYDDMKKDFNDIYIKYGPEKSSYVDQNGKEYTNVPKSDLKKLFDAAERKGLELEIRKDKKKVRF